MCVFNSIKFNYLFIKGVHYFWSNHLQTPWLCSLYIIVYSSNFPPVVLGYLGTDGIFLKSLFSIYCCYTKDLVIVENIPLTVRQIWLTWKQLLGLLGLLLCTKNNDSQCVGTSRYDVVGEGVALSFASGGFGGRIPKIQEFRRGNH